MWLTMSFTSLYLDVSHLCMHCVSGLAYMQFELEYKANTRKSTHLVVDQGTFVINLPRLEDYLARGKSVEQGLMGSFANV